MAHTRLRWGSAGAVTRRALMLAVGFAAILPATTASAQSVYKWTDEHGVVHFADMRPDNVPNVEERGVSAELPLVSNQAAPAPLAQPASAPASGGGFSGHARVILTSREAAPRGPNTRHVIGSVRNVGAEEARQVEVNVRALDQQGSECSATVAEVAPSSLPPGDTGNFDTTISSPCLASGGSVDVEPHWD